MSIAPVSLEITIITNNIINNQSTINISFLIISILPIEYINTIYPFNIFPDNYLLMPLKIVFVGNSFCGDDGIAPNIYKKLKDHPDLNNMELIDIGTPSFDLISHIDSNDQLVIVDALHSIDKKDNIGKVTLLSESDLSQNQSLVSPHDFGIEQTLSILRASEPDLKTVKIIGINIGTADSFSNTLSPSLREKLPKITVEVIKHLTQISGK